jgi:hypothetical protein
MSGCGTADLMENTFLISSQEIIQTEQLSKRWPQESTEITKPGAVLQQQLFWMSKPI